MGEHPQAFLHLLAFDGVADGAVEERRRDLALDQVVDGARLHGLQIEGAAVLPGEQDDGRLAPLRDRLAYEIEAGPLSQAIVDEGYVVPIPADGRAPALVRRHPVELDRQVHDLRQQVPGEDVVVLVVLDEQDAERLGHGAAPYAWSGGKRTIWNQ